MLLPVAPTATPATSPNCTGSGARFAIGAREPGTGRSPCSVCGGTAGYTVVAGLYGGSRTAQLVAHAPVAARPAPGRVYRRRGGW